MENNLDLNCGISYGETSYRKASYALADYGSLFNSMILLIKNK